MQEAIAARLDPNGMGPLKAVTCTFCVSGKLFASQPTGSVQCHNCCNFLETVKQAYVLPKMSCMLNAPEFHSAVIIALSTTGCTSELFVLPSSLPMHILLLAR